MFRGYMPALTCFVFCIGLGIGVSWSRGLIPLTLGSVKSGSLSVEVTQRDPLPPPNDPPSDAARRVKAMADDSTFDDPTISEQQSEPDLDKSVATVAETNVELNRSRVIPAFREAEAPNSSKFVERGNSTDLPPEQSTHLRMRDRHAVRLDPQAGLDDEQPHRIKKSVTAIAHQDPTETANDARETENDATNAPQSPREKLAVAEEKLAAGETLAAHRDLSKLYWNHKDFRPQLQELIDKNAKAIFFQPQPHYVDPYVIQSGDRLEVIAKKYQLSWEYLAKLNRTEPKRIQIGQKLKVMKGPFGAVVDLQDFALTVHLQGYYVKRYTVGIGKDGSSPLGKFSVLNKVENPPYTGPDGKVVSADDPANPLGERWIDLGDSYGIHGTIDPKSIGKAESRGCLRMRDREINEVYDFLVKGSEVALRK